MVDGDPLQDLAALQKIRLVMKIMVFLHGTAIMHRNTAGRAREERVKQVLDGDDLSPYQSKAKGQDKIDCGEGV